MFRNFFKTAFRSLIKNKFFSFINVLGLSVGIAVFLLIFQYVSFETSYEKFHIKSNHIYRITLDMYNGSEFIATDCETYGPLGPLLKTEMPEVKDFVRVYHNEMAEIGLDDKRFKEPKLYFADPSIFDIFSFEFIEGDPKTALEEKFQIVFTASKALKYFGTTDIVGKTIEVSAEFSAKKEPYKITGVIKDVPPNTHLKFDFLISHETLKNWGYTGQSWGGNNEYTYLLMQPGTNLESFNQKLVDLAVKLKDKIGDERFTAESIEDIHLYSHKTFEPEVNGDADTVHFLAIIAILIIIIAWVNYVNLSTARSVERAKEVGIRKVVGSSKNALVIQFLTESFVVNLIALFLGLVFMYFAMPAFKEITGQPLELIPLDNPLTLLILIGLLLTGTCLSGLYPSLVLSGFQPITVLKGKFKNSGHGNFLRKSLSVFQFVVSVILIATTLAVYLQIDFLRSRDLGMNLNNTLGIQGPQLDLPDSTYVAQINVFKNSLTQYPDIEKVARSITLPGLSVHELSTNSGIRRLGTDENSGTYNYYINYVDEDFFDALEIKITQGKNFDQGKSNQDKVIINKEAARLLGFESVEKALGEKLNYRTWGSREASTIIGVVDDFHQISPKSAHLPMIFGKTNSAGYFTVKLAGENTKEALQRIEHTWKEIFPGSPFTYFFLDESYEQQYKAELRFGKVSVIFSGLAIFIACLGLSGLSSYTIIQRTKEIGIRKVLGASVMQILRLLSTEYFRLILVATIIGIPLSNYLITEWLSGFANRIEINWLIYIIPTIIVFMIGLLAVGSQTIKAASANPTKVLRND
ncbi:ABC transporter permease [Flexithrix dorotheae]|uniref:ABC transporter permease n=1 Tax=Flexithrix dorotheae TaxID=70993 RepID=UPI00035DA75C|nr:ABC transporter permease [Flexithrix dorotheae]